MEIIIKDWPHEARKLSKAMQEWLMDYYPSAAIVDADEDFEEFAYAGRIVLVKTEDTRTEEDKKRGCY